MTYIRDTDHITWGDWVYYDEDCPTKLRWKNDKLNKHNIKTKVKKFILSVIQQ